MIQKGTLCGIEWVRLGSSDRALPAKDSKWRVFVCCQGWAKPGEANPLWHKKHQYAKGLMGVCGFLQAAREPVRRKELPHLGAPPCFRLVVAPKFYLNFGGSNGKMLFGRIYRASVN